MTQIDYDSWANAYDTTRGVSPSVLRPLREALGPPAGRSLLDIGGGTGNVALPLAHAGFGVALCDVSPEMVRRAAAKLPRAVTLAVADAQQLPFADETFDCAIAVKVINHIADWRRFLREAHRILRKGPLVLLHATRETMEANWITEYVPSLRSDPRYHSEAETIQALRDAGFVRVAASHMWYTDMEDGSAQALKHHPRAIIDGAHITNTSLFHRLSEAEIRAVIGTMRHDYESGRLQDLIARYQPLVHRNGDGSVFTAWT